jgi:peroxiredoxin
VKGGWLVGAVAVVVLAYITLNTLRTEAVRGLEPGTQLPPFAMPLAASATDGDARITADACTVRGPDVLNLCDVADDKPLVLAFVVTSAGDCEDQIDTLDRVAPRFPGVAFAAIGVRGDHDELRKLARERGWKVPVGYDHDGAVSIRYGLGGVCPMITFARRDGRVAGTEVGVLDEAALTERVEALEAGRPLP